MDSDAKQLGTLYEKVVEEATVVQVKRVNDQTIIVNGQRKNITDFIYEITNLGNDLFTIWTIRRNDKKDETGRVIKHAGDEMKVNGHYGGCQKGVTGVGSPLGSPKERLKRYDILTMCVTSLDDESYLDNPPEKRNRNIGVNDIFRIKAGFTTYEIA